MKNEVCFRINGNDLFAEKILVDYNDIPIFFLCKSDGQYYLVLCTDVKKLCYIIVSLSLTEMYNLLHGIEPMRNFILGKDFWEVISGEDVSSDIVTSHSPEELDISVLPEGGACFNILTEDMKTYVDKFDEEFFSMEDFGSALWKTDVTLETEWFHMLKDVIENIAALSDYFNNAILSKYYTSIDNDQIFDAEKLNGDKKEIAGVSIYSGTGLWITITGSNTAA